MELSALLRNKKEEAFMHPDDAAAEERKKQEREEAIRAKLRDENYIAEMQKNIFQAGERTIHKEIIPAKERVEFYKRRLPYDPNSSLQETNSTRPNTMSSTRVKTAKTRADTAYGQNYRPSFNAFFNAGEKAEFESLVRIESKGSYGSYIPSDNIIEQKIHKMWKETQHKDVAQKRVNDELKQTMKDWGLAKARYEEDIQRKMENRLFGSNFAARAYICKQKPKINMMRNHLNDSDGSSLLSDSEIEEIEKHEKEENQGEEAEEEFRDKVKVKRPHLSSTLRGQQDVRIRRGRAHTAVRCKRKQPPPKLFDNSKDEGDKI